MVKVAHDPCQAEAEVAVADVMVRVIVRPERCKAVMGVDTCGQEAVGVAGDCRQYPGPGIEDPQGSGAVGGLAGDPPPQSVLVGGVDVRL
jgi:hypothetical protein